MQKFKKAYLMFLLPLGVVLFSCTAKRMPILKEMKKTNQRLVVTDTFQAEKNQKGDVFPNDMLIRTWDNNIIKTENLIQGEPILFVLFNPGCGHCKDIVTNVKNNLGMFKEANIIFLAGKPLQGQLHKFVGKMKLDKTEEIVVAGDDSELINRTFEYNGIPQIMIYNKEHRLEHIYYKEANLLEIQNKMYGK